MKLLVPFLLLLAGCGSVHKIVHTNTKKVDSSATVSVDTAYKSLQSQHTDNLSANNVDVTVWYDTNRTYYPADYALAAAKARPVDRSSPKVDQYVAAIRDAVSAGGRAAKIQIHIGSLSDSTGHSVKIDSGSVHKDSQVSVTTAEKKVDKDISRSGWPWYVWLIVVLLAAALIAGILKRFGLL